MKLKGSICIEASSEEVWRALSDVTNLDQWVDPILRARCSGAQTRGKGTVRVCDLQGNMRVTEEFIEWDEGRALAYRSFDAPMMKMAQNRWTVAAVGGKTLLTTESEVVLKGGWLGKLLEPLVRLWSGRVGGDSLAALKYLVEEGRPYRGKFSRLPRGPVAC